MPNIFCFHGFYSLDLSWYLQSKPLMSKTRLTNARAFTTLDPTIHH
jgi:hypothetical protein